jgi:hypothetical protein
MANNPKVTKTEIIGRDRVQIEFLIDDLVKELQKDRGRSVANCNGCNSCGSTVAEIPTKEGSK